MTIPLCLLLLPCASALGQSGDVDAYIHTTMEQRDIPGLSLAVLRDGKMVKRGMYGLANVELNVPVTTPTKFFIASTTKNFAGVAMMMLIAEGKLSPDDKVTDIVPDLPAAWRHATVYQIMTHTSGVPDILEVPGQAPEHDLPGETVRDLIEWVSQKPNAFPPGERWAYNQTGYVLAAMIIEEVTGGSWEEFAQQRFFDPLDMKDTGWGDQRDLIPHRAYYYEDHADGGIRPYTNLKYSARTRTAAGLVLTMDDMIRWTVAVQNGDLLDRRFLDELWTPVRLNSGEEFRMWNDQLGYGFGWMVVDFASGHHAVGGEGGTTNAWLYFPEERLTVIVMTNKLRCNDIGIVTDVAKFFITDLEAGR